MARESMTFDVVIVGAGVAGLAAAIRLKQLAAQHQQELSVCIVEKGAEVGAHILSGCVFEPRALNELIPDWQSLDAPLVSSVLKDEFYFLSKRKALRLPTPPSMRNHGNYIISLGRLCQWLAQYASNLGIEIFPGFAATELLVNEAGQAYGIATGDMGLNKQGQATERYQSGIELHAKQILLAEGCRGSLSKQVIKQFNLDQDCQPQTYAIGIKELWQVDKKYHSPGLVQHTIGWPLDSKTYGGSFVYHLENQQVAVGFVIGLDYENPYLNPFEEMQQFKTHPHFKKIFSQGERLCYGARALNEGGFQSIPHLSFPGGLIIGDAAGFLNVAKIKGSHTAMKSGMVASEVVFANLFLNKTLDYRETLQQSWIWPELYKVRNIRPGFHHGILPGLANAALETYIFRGKAPWTLKHKVDHLSLKNKNQCTPLQYPTPDNKTTFDKLSSLYLSGVNHEEQQPCHLQLKDTNIPIEYNLKEFDAPEQRYCPANVYEIITIAEKPSLQINAQNCIHCKTCDIKDPKQNINWVPPEGGGGPHYQGM